MRRALAALTAAALVLSPDSLLAGTTVAPPNPIDAARTDTMQNIGDAEYERGLDYACARGFPRNLPEAAKWFHRAADKGHALAQSALGWMLMTGRGVKRDDAEAARWLQLAAERGVVPAQNNLAVLYVMGQGVPHNHSTAEHWFRAAAEQGAIDAQRNLDTLLTQGAQTSPPVAVRAPF
jgi:TPR repeat protein